MKMMTVMAMWTTIAEAPLMAVMRVMVVMVVTMATRFRFTMQAI